jgi:Ca-activated chloride channel family protein
VNLAHPGWAAPLALGLLGLALVCGLAVRRARRAQQRLLGDVPGAGGLGDAVLWIALLALCIALLGPRIGTQRVRLPATGIDLVLLMDVSRSMDARDVAPSRAARAQQIAAKLLRELSAGDRVALAAFAGGGALLTPLSHDKQALLELLPSLDTGLMSDTGSRLWKGAAAALPAFDEDGLRPRLLLVLSDGERAHVAPEAAFERIAAADVRVVSVAIGSEAGAPIPTPTGPLIDARGRTVQSKRETRGLSALAEATGGAVLSTDRWGAVDPASLLTELRAGARPAGAGFIERQLPVTRTAVPAALALALLLLEAVAWRPGGPLGRRAFRFGPRRRNRGRAGAAAALSALVALTLLPPGANSEGPDARVRRRPDDTAALLALGVARAAEGDPLEAERAFLAAAVRAEDPNLVALAYYDLGVSALQRGQYERARWAFLDALAVAPGDPQTRFNLEWTVRELARRELAPAGGDPSGPPSDEPAEEPEPAQGEPADAAEELPLEGEAEEEAEDGEQEAAADPSPNTGLPPRVPPLSPEAAEHWLENVSDDAARGLQQTARQGAAEKSAGPDW